MLKKKDIIIANQKFCKGIIVNEGSLDFAVSQVQRSKNWLKSAAILTRAILIDHVFEEGNKRTTAAIIGALMEMHNLVPDKEKIAKGIEKILKKNITSIKEIERVIKDGIRVH
ncbi:MAG: hypothetical protein QW331_02035 [Candidatus Woesearchaeota archaeon]